MGYDYYNEQKTEFANPSLSISKLYSIEYIT